MYDLMQLLMKIGLSDKEAKIYLVSLKVGTNPASIIAKRSELNRCTAYSLLESLIKKGMMYQVEKDTVKYFTAVGPRQLIMCLEEKQREIAHYKSEVVSRITEFDTLRHPNQILPQIKSYSGKAGIKKLYNESINEPFLFINATEDTKQHAFFGQYAKIFLEYKKEIHLSLRTKDSTKNIRIADPNELKLIPNCSPTEFIGKYKLFIIDPEDEYGIEIRQPRIISDHQKQFHYLWKMKKDPLR